FQRFGVGWIPSSARFFAVLDSCEFVILDPQIGLQDFCRRRESEQSGVAFVIGSLLSPSSCSPNTLEAEPKSAAPGASAIAPAPMRQRKVRRGSVRGGDETLAT